MRRARFTVGAAWGLVAVTASVGCASHNAGSSRASLAATGSTSAARLEGVWEEEVWETPSYYNQGVRRIALKVFQRWLVDRQHRRRGLRHRHGRRARRSRHPRSRPRRPRSMHAPFPQGQRRTAVGHLRNVVHGAHRGGADRSLPSRSARRRSGRGCGRAMTSTPNQGSHLPEKGRPMFKRSLLVVGLAFLMVSVASPADVSVSEQTFGCILDWPQVRNTRIKHADPQQLAEAIRIFRDSVPNVEYPDGTILQLVPFEAMVKHPREKFPKTNGWEFFALDISATAATASSISPKTRRA